MEQNSFFQNPVDFDFFSSLRLPINLPFSDPFDMFNRRKDSLLSLGSPRHRLQSFHDLTMPAGVDPATLFNAPKPDDLHLDANSLHKSDALLKDLQSMPMPVSDAGLDPFLNRDFTFNPYQICRSRAGSFNYNRFRRDSEDLFHSNSDLFRQFCSSIADTRNSFENAFQNIVNFPKNTQSTEKFIQNPHMQATMDSFINDAHTQPFSESTSATLSNLSGLGAKLEKIQENTAKDLAVTSKTTASTFDFDNQHEDIDEEEFEPEGKKMLLNNGSEVRVDQKATKKVGRPKKLDIKKVKTQGSTIIKIETKASKSAKKPINQETSAPAQNETKTKIEQAQVPVSFQQSVSQPPATQTRVNSVTDLSQLKVPDNLKQIIEGSNIPKDVQEFFKNSYSNLFDTRRIGTLTVAERKAKVDRYLEKRKKRTYSRKSNYDCRKRVADNRLRIKGRFVTRIQAFGLLEEAGIPYDPETITNPEIKTLLTEKAGAGASTLKKRSIKEQKGEFSQEVVENDYNEGNDEEDEEDQE